MRYLSVGPSLAWTIRLRSAVRILLEKRLEKQRSTSRNLEGSSNPRGFYHPSTSNPAVESCSSFRRLAHSFGPTLLRGNNLSGSILTNVENLKCLAQDMAQISSGKFDFSSIGGQCPRLDQIAIAQKAIPCLAGIMTGHPSIEDGRHAVTSQVFYLDPERGYARTYSRWYIIGEMMRIPTGRER
jgi:hypothetical protein